MSCGADVAAQRAKAIRDAQTRHGEAVRLETQTEAEEPPTGPTSGEQPSAADTDREALGTRQPELPSIGV